MSCLQIMAWHFAREVYSEDLTLKYSYHGLQMDIFLAIIHLNNYYSSLGQQNGITSVTVFRALCDSKAVDIKPSIITLFTLIHVHALRYELG